jgi:hypothetical protein
LTVGGAELGGVSYSNKEGSRRVLVGRTTPPRAVRVGVLDPELEEGSKQVEGVIYGRPRIST